jgi:uncharacterized OB-fold protein
VTATVLPAEAVRITTNPQTEPFWLAAQESKLVACQCASCGHFRMPPTPFCPECQSVDKAWPELPGTGEVFSFSVVHGFPGLPDITLVAAVIDLDGAPGARLVSNVIGVEADDVQIGMRVTVAFSPISDGWLLPVFTAA